MKHLVSYALFEVGESLSAPYRYWRDEAAGWVSIYRFTTDRGVEYEVEFSPVEPELHHVVQVVFSANGSSTEVVNRGELFRVMATVMQITREVLEQDAELRVLVLAPTQNRANDLRRQRLYLKYVTHEWPKARVRHRDDEIWVQVR